MLKSNNYLKIQNTFYFFYVLHLCQAEEKVKRLEESIEQTQKSENCIAEFQQWLETTDQQLTSRIQNDFSPQDLPNDVEVS